MKVKHYYVVEMEKGVGKYDPETFQDRDYFHPFETKNSMGDVTHAYKYAQLTYPDFRIVGHHIVWVSDDPNYKGGSHTIEELNQIVQEFFERHFPDGIPPEFRNGEDDDD